MIIADKQSWKKISVSRSLRNIAKLGVLVLVLFFTYPLLMQWMTHTRPGELYFDAETNWNGSFISNGQFFSGAKQRSSEAAHNGRYSNKIPLADGNGYGVSGRFTQFEAGKSYRASVYFKTETEGAIGGLVVQGETPEIFYNVTEDVAEEDLLTGWKKLVLDFDIPFQFTMEFLEFFVYTDGKSIVYFDDLEILPFQQKSSPMVEEVKIFDPPLIKLKLTEGAYQQIKSKRDEAKKKGLLMTDAESWVKAFLEDGKATVPVKIRLKGDWTDHLDGDKWSFRVKVKDSYSWNRLIVFSLQTPKARYFADEWVLHKFWEKEDVLTTRYDFVNLELNGNSLGVYAYEEHFDKQLLEFKNRREGPILRFTEDALWAFRYVKFKEGYDDYFPAVAQLEVADIQPFKEGRTASNPKLHADFEIARTLLHQYQTGEKKAADIFDLERLAKYHAICDVMGAHHAVHWHNQRYYYNPVIGKLEPIGYDGHSGKAHHLPFLLGQSQVRYSRYEYISTIKRLVEDEEFIQEYLKYLNLFTSEDYLVAFLKELGDHLEWREAFIQQEFTNYTFDRKALLNRAKRARIELTPYANHSVKAYWKADRKATNTLVLRNFHEMPLVFVGTGKNEKRMTNPLKQSRVLSAYYFGYPAKNQEFEVAEEARFIFYQPYGIDTLFSSPISTWSAELQVVPPQELNAQPALKSNDWYDVGEQVIRFKPGLHEVNKDIIIPANFEVLIHAGTQLDFQQGAKFISYSPVKLQGTSDQPIRIVSSDESANGFTVLQAKSTSEMHYVIFDHFNTLSDRGWQLTGAVTFYESDVNMSHCIFENNHCEDGLNLVRSKFYMDQVTVRNTPSDGFDADFCEGTIKASHFNNTGNDGIDFSGSKITIESCFMKDNGDKAISVGEDSEVLIKEAKVDGAVIGAASKDLSYLRINNIDLKNCNQGFAAYQKKPEYGPSIIQIDKYQKENLRYLYTIAPRCTLRLEHKSIVGE